MGKNKKQPKISLVELAPTSKGDMYSNIVEDVYTKIQLPSRAIPQLHAILIEEGYENVESIDTRYNPRGNITSSDLERINNREILMASSIIRTLPQTLQLAEEYKNSNPEGTFITGGHPATFLPETCLNNGVDIVVRGEGDKTTKELMRVYENGGNLENVRGVSYKNEEGKIIHNELREFCTKDELDILPTPHYPDFMKGKRGVVETARGCPYGCEYCGVTRFFGEKFRRRSNDKVISDLENIIEAGTDVKCVKNIFFTDDHFAMEKELTKDLLKKISEDPDKKGLNKISYSAQLSINSAFKPNSDEIDEEFMQLLKKANFGYAFLGIESITDDVLKEWNKPATAERNMKAVKAFREKGIPVHGMMMVGGDNDTQESLDYTLDWCKENLDSVQFFSPIPLPGTPFGDKMAEEGRIIPDNFPNDYHLYDGQYVVLEPKRSTPLAENFTPLELQEKIFNMYEEFYGIRGNLLNILKSPKKIAKAGINYYAPKIIKSVKKDPQTVDYMERLKEVS